MQKSTPALLIMGTEDEVSNTFGVQKETQLKEILLGNCKDLEKCEVRIASAPKDIKECIEHYTVLGAIAFVQTNTWKAIFLYEFQKQYPQIALIGIFEKIQEKEVQFAKELFMEGIFEQKRISLSTFSFCISKEMKKRLEHEDAMNVFQHKLVFGELGFLQHTFWRNTILDERWFDDAEMFAKGKELGIKLNISDTYVIVLLRLLYERKGMEEKNGVKYYEECRHLFPHTAGYEVVEIDTSAICLIIPVRESGYHQMCDNVSEFVRKSEEELDIGWATYTSTVTLLPILRQKYLEVCEMERRNIYPKCKNYLLENMPLYNRVNVIEGSVWIQSFAEGKIELIRKEIADFIDMLVDKGELNIESMYGMVHRLSMAFYASMEMRKQPVNEILTTREYLEKFNLASKSVENLYEFLDYLEGYNESVIRDLQKDHFISGQIRQYIKDNIEQDLTREEIAQQFFMSKDYISHIFKKETGVSLISAINEEKIKRAKELLLTSSASVSEIATNLGITNFSYFTRIFKKDTGVSPQEFRKNAWNRI